MKSDQQAAEEWFDKLHLDDFADPITSFLAGAAHVRAEFEPEIKKLRSRVILREQEIIQALLDNKVIKYY